MSNTQAMCTSFKTELLGGHHALGTSVVRASTAADVIKAALFLASGALSSATTAYSTTSEATGTNYSAGGITVTNGNAPTSTGTTAFWTPSANFVYGSGGSPLTISSSFDAVLLYNSTQSNKAISVHTFGGTTITAGIFTLTMPTHDAANGLIRIA